MEDKEVRKRILGIILTGVMALSLCACGEKNEPAKESQQSVTEENNEMDKSDKNMSNPSADHTSSSNVNDDGTLKESRLTEEEKTIVGIWESDIGDIAAIRERKNSGDDFHLDAIVNFAYDEELTEYQWAKITREDGSSFYEEDGDYILRDVHECPVDASENAVYVETVEQLAYNPDTDTLTYSSKFDGDDTAYCIEFHRTDKSIETADWDWYYEIEPSRDPR